MGDGEREREKRVNDADNSIIAMRRLRLHARSNFPCQKLSLFLAEQNGMELLENFQQIPFSLAFQQLSATTCMLKQNQIVFATHRQGCDVNCEQFPILI